MTAAIGVMNYMFRRRKVEPAMSVETRTRIEDGCKLMDEYRKYHGSEALRKLHAECGLDFTKLFDAIRAQLEIDHAEEELAWQEQQDTQNSVRP